MNERDLIREARAALDDLAEHAPEAPSLEAITSGYAPLRRIETPPTRWRTAAILASAAAVTLVVLGVAALIGSDVGDGDGVSGPGVTTSDAGPAIEGTWVLTGYTYEGATQSVDEAALVAQGRDPAWIEISLDGVTGYTGCNTIESASAPEQGGDVLVFDEVLMTAVGCLDETSEPALLEALWSGPDGVTVSFTSGGKTMTWTTDAVGLTFERRDRVPTALPGAWSVGFDRLDCAPGVVLTQTLPDTGQTLPDTLVAVPGVVRVEGGEPFSWGLDEGGIVIAGAAYGDIEPRVIQLDTCASSFGVRADADLAAATFTWVNDLGLAQTSPLVWGPRFVELCSSDGPDLGALALRYLDEDAATSVRSDGGLPSLEQTTQTLEIIGRSTCAAGRSQTPTTVSPQSQDAATTTTTVVAPLDLTACSATGMEPPADYPPSYENLPDPVARTWGMLFDAALGCDFEGLIAIAQEGSDSESNDAIFWGAASSTTGLIGYDATSGSLRSLVLALTTLPTAPFEGQRYDAKTQTVVPQNYWSWPPVHDDLGNGVGIEDLWDADTLERVAALNNMTVAELVASIDEFGGYAGFRVGIAEDGTWLFALAGD
ncbi:MAG: META domain-containing protein [Actinomycetia bacterium]|nr:META domain-containing protein [Actinomycetes bacterium]